VVPSKVNSPKKELAALPEGMNEGKSQNISSEVVAILPILPLPFEEEGEIILNNQTSLENNNLIEFTGTVVDRNPYALVLALVPVLTIFGLFYNF